MEWKEASKKIQQLKKDELITTSRKILQIPPYLCNSKRYNYNEPGFEIKIGKKSKIKIPVSIIQYCYEEALKNGGLYNRQIFKKLYPFQLSDHACHVHSIGQLFVKAGLADFIDKQNYKMKDNLHKLP